MAKDATSHSPVRPFPATTKTPTKQMKKLSPEESEKMRQWLDSTDRPFSVMTVPFSRKRKRESTNYAIQDGLWEDRLSVQYEVRPKDKWESLNKYSRLTVAGIGISIGQCILVKHDDKFTEEANIADQWKAKILEVRALDGEHVYVRVVWLNRPEDLASGRKPYHGVDELIPTNQMDIIDAMSINGALEIVHYNDTEDDSAVIRDSYFWRQTYDHVNTRSFSKLRNICIDSQPVNPDELIMQCSNQKCRKWMHVKCIAEAAAQRAAAVRSPKPGGSIKKGRAIKVPPKIKLEVSHSNPASANGDEHENKIDVKIPEIDVKVSKVACDAASSASAQVGGAVSQVYIKGLPEEDPDLFTATAATENKIVVTSVDGTVREEPLSCLFCQEPIDDE